MLSVAALPAMVLALVLMLPLCAHAHGGAFPRPTAEEAGQLRPPIPGCEALALELSRHGRGLFTQAGQHALDAAVRGFAVAGQIGRGEVEERDPAVAPYNRQLGEDALLALLEGHEGLVTFDFAKGVLPDHRVPIALEGQACAVLVKVVTGEGGTECRVVPVNLSTSGDPGPYTLEVPTEGVLYLLLDLAEIPPGQTELTLGFRPRGASEARWWHAVTLRREPLGQLAVRIVDETGTETPAFVRLTARDTGKLWEPPNAIDLGPIMTSITGLDIYGPGRGYTHYLPGANRGTYWVVPGPFEMALPAGEWDIRVYHGPEYEAVEATVSVRSGERTRREIALKRWVDMPAEGWYSGDDHVHARLMHSEDARAVMAFARAADIHVANILEMGNTVRTWYAQRGFGPDFRVTEGDYALVPGQEDPRSAFGHAIGLNLTALARDPSKYMLNDWVADEVHRQGGLYGHTHVGEGGLGIRKDMTLLMPRGKSDFGSIMQNRLGTERYYEFLNLGFRLAASAGSDTPYGGAVGVVRCYGHLGEGARFSPDGWFEAVRAGRTFVTNGPMLDFWTDGVPPGGEVRVNEDRALHVCARARGIPGGSAPARLDLVRGGETVQTVVSEDPAQGELRLDTTVPTGFGGWLAVHAVGHDGSEAHTTPVYVVREGFRTWNVEKAEGLLAARMATLVEIEGLVGDAERKLKAGELSALDHWNRCLAEQAAEVRERVDLVREIYRALGETLRKERASSSTKAGITKRWRGQD